MTAAEIARKLRLELFYECPDCDGAGSLGKVLVPGLAYRQSDVGKEAACGTCGGNEDQLGRGSVLEPEPDADTVWILLDLLEKLE